jgi:integrase
MATIYKISYRRKSTDGTVEKRRCSCWYIQYVDRAGKRKRIRGYVDKGATKQLAAQLERDLARGETNLIDPYKRSNTAPIAEQLRDYLADLRTAGRDRMYVYNADKRLAKMIDGCRWSTLAAIDANGFVGWRERAKASTAPGPGKLGKTLSATTLNQYLATIHAFCEWCVEQKRMAGNPLTDVRRVTGEKVRQRRALSDDEIARILAKTGSARKLVYRMALATGLRRDELTKLRWGDLRLRAIKPYIQLATQNTKARRADRLALPQTLAQDLRQTRPRGAADADRIFDVPTIEEWKEDLAAAGIAYADGLGRRADFHALRKTLCTRLHRAGTPLALAMRVMRHTDARLTLVDYTDDEALGADDAAAALPEIVAAQPAKPAAASGGK